MKKDEMAGTTNSPKTISIIIPVYNEERSITHIIDSVIHADSVGLKKEIIIVDDGSTDKTHSKIKQLQVKIKLHIITKNKNEGKGAAIRSGIKASTGDIVLIQDADLEYNPADYPLLLEPFLKYSADVVYGSRFISNRPHRILYFWHYVGNIILTLLSNMVTNLNLTDMETGYKAFRGTIIRQIAPHLKSNQFGFEPEVTALLARIKNIKFYEVGISYLGRTYSEGKKIGWKDGLHAVWVILKYGIMK